MDGNKEKSVMSSQQWADWISRNARYGKAQHPELLYHYSTRAGEVYPACIIPQEIDESRYIELMEKTLGFSSPGDLEKIKLAYAAILAAKGPSVSIDSCAAMTVSLHVNEENDPVQIQDEVQSVKLHGPRGPKTIVSGKTTSPLLTKLMDKFNPRKKVEFKDYFPD